MVEKDLTGAIEENGAQYLQEIEERRREVQAEGNLLRQRLAVVDWEADAMFRLQRYLTQKKVSGGYSWDGVSPRPEVEGNGAE